MTEGAITPIFVLGLQRSGTTWVANLLAAHPQIAAVTAAEHRGVHESVFFSHFATMFGPWEDEEARGRFREAFVASDYFLLTGLDRRWAETIEARSHGDYFRQIMDAHARNHGAQAWVEKSPHHTLLADRIAADYPDAVFVCIVRDGMDLIRSRLWSYGRRPPAYPGRASTILKGSGSIVYHRRYLEAFCRRHPRAHLIDFATLGRDAGAALAPVASDLGIDGFAGLTTDFAPNSSFTSASSRAKGLTPVDRLVASVALRLSEAAPSAILAAAQNRAARRRAPAFPPWVWRRNPQLETRT